jgi:hypothetical protein
MEKVPGVESATVSLNEGRAVLKLKPENTLTLGKVRESVRRNGFTPRDAQISAIAETVAGEPLRLRITGTPDVYDVRATAAIEKLLRAVANRPMIVEGTVPFENDANSRMVLQVTSVKPVTR